MTFTLDTQRIDALCAAWDTRTTPGVSLAIVHDGEVVYQRGYGMSNLEHDVPITPDSIFHVASISKQFTDMCIAMLAVEGQLRLDDDIRHYVPEIPDYGHVITIRHLIHHTSGLRDQWDLLSLAGWRDDDLITEGDVLWAAGRQRALNFPPGEQHLYCNTAYTLLALIIHRVTGQTLRQFAQERIFAPLGITPTHFHDDHAEIVPGRTQAYAPGPDGGNSYKISIPVFDVAGTTSLFTTTGDLARWANNFEDMRVGGAEAFALTLTRGVLNDGRQLAYAFGLVYRDYKGLEIIEHGGADAGYRAHFMRVPAERVAVIALCNFAQAHPQALCDSIFDSCLADRLRAEPASDARPTPAQTAARAGLYRNAESGDILRLAAADDVLQVDLFSQPWPLEPLDEWRYQIAGFGSTVIAFDASNPDAFTFGGSDPKPFERVEEARPAPAELAAYAGAYASDELDVTYTLAVEDDGLVLRRKKQDDLRLRPATRDAFLGGDLRLEFTRNPAGAVDGFAVSTGRSRGITFARA